PGQLWRYMAISYPSSEASSVPWFHGRHLGSGNVLWFDGHVTTERVTPLPATYQDPTTTGASASDYNRMHLGYLMPKNTQYSDLNANFFFWLDKTRRNLT